MRYARNVINTDFRSCEKCDLILEQFIFTREIFQSSFPFFFPLESLKYRRVYLVARKQREITIRQNINARGKKYLYDAFDEILFYDSKVAVERKKNIRKEI